jgi:hypothetical protein
MMDATLILIDSDAELENPARAICSGELQPSHHPW